MLKVVKFKKPKSTFYDKMVSEVMNTVRENRKDIMGFGYFIRTKTDSYYNSCGRSDHMIVGSQLLAKECLDYAAKEEK